VNEALRGGGGGGGSALPGEHGPSTGVRPASDKAGLATARNPLSASASHSGVGKATGAESGELPSDK